MLPFTVTNTLMAMQHDNPGNPRIAAKLAATAVVPDVDRSDETWLTA